MAPAGSTLRARAPGRAAVVLAVATVLAALAPTGCSGADDDDGASPASTTPLRITSGNPGGVFVAYAEGIGAAAGPALGRRAEIEESPGSETNLRRVADGRADVGFSLADSAGAAVHGRAPFGRPLRLAALATIYANYLQVVVRADGGVRRLDDLAGRRVSVGAAGSGTRPIARRVLAAAGLDGRVRERSSSLRDAVGELRRGEIDALVWSGGLPTSAIAEARGRRGLRLLDLAGLAARLRERHGDYYDEVRVRRAIYGAGPAVQTIAVGNLLVVPRDMPDAEAFALTRTLFASRRTLERAHPEGARLSPRNAIATYDVPLHPGAVRWYRETHR